MVEHFIACRSGRIYTMYIRPSCEKVQLLHFVMTKFQRGVHPTACEINPTAMMRLSSKHIDSHVPMNLGTFEKIQCIGENHPIVKSHGFLKLTIIQDFVDMSTQICTCSLDNSWSPMFLKS